MPKTPRRKQTLRAQRSQRTKDEWHENLETDGSGKGKTVTIFCQSHTCATHEHLIGYITSNEINLVFKVMQTLLSSPNAVQRSQV